MLKSRANKILCNEWEWRNDCYIERDRASEHACAVFAHAQIRVELNNGAAGADDAAEKRIP